MSFYVKELGDTDFIFGEMSFFNNLSFNGEEVQTFYTQDFFQLSGNGTNNPKKDFLVPVKIEILPFNEETNQGAFNISLMPNYNLFRTITVSGVIYLDDNNDLNYSIIPIANQNPFFVSNVVFCWSVYLLDRLNHFLNHTVLISEKDLIKKYFDNVVK